MKSAGAKAVDLVEDPVQGAGHRGEIASGRVGFGLARVDVAREILEIPFHDAGGAAELRQAMAEDVGLPLAVLGKIQLGEHRVPGAFDVLDRQAVIVDQPATCPIAAKPLVLRV
ncbi:MAG: hypothetical protein V4618_04455 [Pseudomonadota bacterium]